MENQDSSSTMVVILNTNVKQVPVHPHSIFSDHQLEVDGVIYRKLKTLNRVVIQVFLQISDNL